jgi:hypothetical protein
MDEFSRISGGFAILSKEKGIFVNYWVLSHVRWVCLLTTLMATNKTDSSRFVNQIHGNKKKTISSHFFVHHSKWVFSCILQFCDIKKINENFPKYLKNESNFYTNELRKFPKKKFPFLLSKERTQKIVPKTKIKLQV